MTKYTTLNSREPKITKKTVFHSFIGIHGQPQQALLSPCGFDNVLYLGTDETYGSLFKVWNNSNEENFTIYFGEKGDEFN